MKPINTSRPDSTSVAEILEARFDPACRYLIQTCPCGPSDIEWSCRCTNQVWNCGRGYDCYRCSDASADAPSPDAGGDALEAAQDAPVDAAPDAADAPAME